MISFEHTCGPCIAGWLGSWVGMEVAFLEVSQSSKKLCPVPKFWMVSMKWLKWLYFVWPDCSETAKPPSDPLCMYSDAQSLIPWFLWAESHSAVFNSLWLHGLHRHDFTVHGIFQARKLEWIFPTQGSNQGLLHFRQILYQLSRQGSPLWAEIELKERSLSLLQQNSPKKKLKK